MLPKKGKSISYDFSRGEGIKHGQIIITKIGEDIIKLTNERYLIFIVFNVLKKDIMEKTIRHHGMK